MSNNAIIDKRKALAFLILLSPNDHYLPSLITAIGIPTSDNGSVRSLVRYASEKDAETEQLMNAHPKK